LDKLSDTPEEYTRRQMFTYKHLLRITGYTGIFDIRKLLEEAEEVELVIDPSGIHNTTTSNQVRFIWLYRAINVIYRIFVLTALLWFPVMTIIKATREKEHAYFTANIYSFMILFQTWFGYRYTTKGNYFEMLEKYEYLERYMRYYAMASIVIPVVITVITTSLFVIGEDMGVYTVLYESGSRSVKRLLVAGFVIERFYSYLILITNMLIFTLVMNLHANRINRFHETLEKKTLLDEEEVEIVTIINDFTSIKYEHATSVDLLNGIFASYMMLGSINLYVVFDNQVDFIGIQQYINAGFYITISLVYFWIISSVKNETDDIRSFVQSPRFTGKYLAKEAFASRSTEVPGIPDDATEKSVLLEILIRSNETAVSNDWLLLFQNLNTEWKSFEIFGFEIDDSSVAQKVIGIVLTVFIASDLKDALFT